MAALGVAPAQADGGLELGGFVGVEEVSSQASLGDSMAPEQRPQTSPILGMRLGYVYRAHRFLHVGSDAELTFAPSWTDYGFESGRSSYFAPVIGYRAELLLRLPLRVLAPHATVGLGGQTVASNSPFITTDTDLVWHVGIGATVEVVPRWQIRLDGRRSIVPASNGATTANYELLIGFVARLGLPPTARPTVPDTESGTPPRQGAGDRRDVCAVPSTSRPECRPSDPDGDGLAGESDKCPAQPEDMDGFQDSDGCPEPDRDADGDGLVDTADPCPDRAETINGFDDSDGCPDAIPEFIALGLTAARNVRFEPGRARLTNASKRALDQVVVALRTPAVIHVVITAYPDSGRADLATKRADVVKWYLVEHGVPADELHVRIATLIKPAGPPIEIAITPK